MRADYTPTPNNNRARSVFPAGESFMRASLDSYQTLNNSRPRLRGVVLISGQGRGGAISEIPTAVGS
jgi:hypothetical protein